MSINGANLYLYNTNTKKLQNQRVLATNPNIVSGYANPIQANASDSVSFTNNALTSSNQTSQASSVAQELKGQLEKTKSEQGLIGKAWDGIKNLFGMKAGSKNVEATIQKLENGEITEDEARAALTKYQDGQKMCVDVVGDMLSGIVAVGAVMAAPFTGGASLLLGAAVGAGVKVAIKAGDAAIGGREYKLKDLGYDLITGSINGAMAPITNALGGAAGTGVAKACGLNVVKTATKEGVEAGAKSAGKSALTKLLAKQGTEYVAKEGAKAGIKTTVSKIAAYGVDMAIDGAVSGATDGFARSLADGDFENMGANIKQGFVGGLIAAPVIGGGFRIAGKAGSKLFRKGAANAASDAVADTTARGLSEGLTEGVAGAGILGGATVTVRRLSNGVSDAAADTTARETSEAAADSIIGTTRREIAESTNDAVGDVVARESSEAVEGVAVRELSEMDNLYAKVQKQLNITSVAEIEDFVNQITKNTGTTREETLFAMQVLTQYGNMTSLKELSTKLQAFGNFRSTGLSLNTALNYVGNKKDQFKLLGSDQIFLLDDSGLKYLERLSKKELNKMLGNPDLTFVNIQGWNSGLNVYNLGIDSGDFVKNTESLISQAKKLQVSGLSFDEAFREVVDATTIERANRLGIKGIETVSLTDSSKLISTDSIARNLEPLNISSTRMKNIIEAMGDELFPSDKVKAQRAKELITGYLDSELDIYSPRRLSEQMKKMHRNLEQTVSALTKSDGTHYTMNDVVYLIPNTGKSYEQVALQYSLANGIDTGKFLYHNATDIPNLPDGQIYVVLDDVVGGGSSILSQWDGFKYSSMNSSSLGDRHVIMQPVVSGQTGRDSIVSKITKQGRDGQDFLLIDDLQVRKPFSETEYYKSLSSEDQKMLDQILRDIGSDSPFNSHGLDGKSAYAIIFPYMWPDNDATLPSLIFETLILNPNAIKNHYSKSNSLTQNVLNRIKAMPE